MITISLCMIVKNEEDVLDRCLSCVKDLVEEVIIVDTGSTDETKKIASKYTDRIFPFSWIDDFSAARNYAFSKATMDYCMWLDADDVIGEKDRMDFLTLKHSLLPEIDMVMMRYHTGFDENGNPSFWYYRERIIRNNQKYLWCGAVHEVIVPDGNIVYSDVAISHKKLHAGDPDRNLNIYRKMLADGKKLNARESYYYARELYYHNLYEEALETFIKFLSFPDAWIENKMESCVLMAKCYLELHNPSACLQILLKTLEYDVPRAEVCCEIGAYFMESKQYEIAVFWFETALNCKTDFKRGGFILSDCYNYLPSIQLCVCYDRMGQHEKAQEYNEKAGMLKPNSFAFLYNQKYFNQLEKEGK